MQAGYNYIKYLGYKVNKMNYRMWTFNHGIYVFNPMIKENVF